MRNRVARTAARTLAAKTSKLVLVMVLVPATLLALAPAASASPRDVAAEPITFGVFGPIGIAAVVLGFGGLVLGLLRLRRRETAAAAATVLPVTLPVDTSGQLPGLDAVTPPVEPATGERMG